MTHRPLFDIDTLSFIYFTPAGLHCAPFQGFDTTILSGQRGPLELQHATQPEGVPVTWTSGHMAMHGQWPESNVMQRASSHYMQGSGNQCMLGVCSEISNTFYLVNYEMHRSAYYSITHSLLQWQLFITY